MSRIFQRLVAVLLAFSLGVLIVWSMGLLTKAEMLLAKSYPHLVFSASSRGCGCGYSQDYSILDGRFMSEGASFSDCSDTKKRLESEISKATKIMERVPKINRFGEQGERIVVLYYSENSKAERAMILWHNEDGMSYIDGPTLEIALGFEEANAYNS